MMAILGPIIAGLLSAAPQIIPHLPHTAATIASGAIAAAGALWHLFQPVPSK